MVSVRSLPALSLNRFFLGEQVSTCFFFFFCFFLFLFLSFAPRSGFAKLSLIGGLLSLSAFALAGYLGDRYGRKKLGVVGIMVKTAVDAGRTCCDEKDGNVKAKEFAAPGCGFLQCGSWCRVSAGA